MLEQLLEAIPEIRDEDYRGFIEAHNGGEGTVGDDYLVLDSVDDVLGPV